MKEKPSISVVVPTFNRKDSLRKCLESLFHQSFPIDDYEIIVVDDGSDDGTYEVVSDLQKESPIVLRYYKQKNRGPASARNLGIKKSHRKIIAFIDDDCVAKFDWLTHLTAMFKAENIGGVEGKVEIIGKKTALTYNVAENISGGNYITGNIAYTKEVLNSVNHFDENLLRLEDLDLAYRIMKENKKIIFCDKAIVFHPAIEYNIIDFLKRLKYISNYLRLYDKNPEIGNIKKFLFFMIFVRPFSITRWKNCMKYPETIPKFILMNLSESFYCLYLLILVIFKLNIHRQSARELE